MGIMVVLALSTRDIRSHLQFVNFFFKNNEVVGVKIGGRIYIEDIHSKTTRAVK